MCTHRGCTRTQRGNVNIPGLSSWLGISEVLWTAPSWLSYKLVKEMSRPDLGNS